MQLVKVGDIVINMAMVTDVFFHEDGVNVYFAVDQRQKEASPFFGSSVRELRFRGEEAQALRQWIEGQAIDVMKPPSLDVL